MFYSLEYITVRRLDLDTFRNIVILLFSIVTSPVTPAQIGAPTVQFETSTPVSFTTTRTLGARFRFWLHFSRSFSGRSSCPGAFCSFQRPIHDRMDRFQVSCQFFNLLLSFHKFLVPAVEIIAQYLVASPQMTVFIGCL